MDKVTTSLHAVEWKVAVADAAAPWNETTVGTVRRDGGRYEAWRGSRLLGSYATREGAKRAVVKDWQR